MRRFVDPALGVLGAGVGIGIAFAEEVTRGPVWANVVAFAIFGVLLALRSRAQVAAAFGFVALVVVLGAVLTPPPDVIVISMALPLFGFTAGASRLLPMRRAYLPAIFAGITVANLGVDGSTAGDWIFPSALSVAAFLAGRNTAYRSALADELRDATAVAEQTQGEEERRAVAAERRRIAREMHDIVAHSISVMVVQAGGARRVLQRDATRAEQAAAQIERTGRETLAEMRRMLGVMHGGVEPAELEPNPTLADLGGLCGRLGATLAVSGEPSPIPLGLEIGVYRIVEETAGAGASVDVQWSDTALTIHIRPYGPALGGVRERVALYEGELSADLHELAVSFPLHNDVSPPARSLTQ